ncbi:MAG TPA: OmpA family protein [Candidatus Limnocylindria bacterium]|nr:OmpA family protein [Candidatus Limnocylindria bacterium]
MRHLIVAPEQEGLQEIRDRLDSMERRAEDVSSVVAEAIQMRREQGDDEALAEALAPTIQETLRESVRKDPQVLADALFPVMGPAIRKSISETLRAMLESFNEALEHSLSLRGIQWRIEAFRTGKPFAEIVLMHSLLYRVEQVFLIHRETGLVLHHVVASAVATQDPDMVAGMLSAIQQFARDSFKSAGEETLGSMNFEELEIWLEASPDAVLAAVIRGHAPSDYRLAMKEALENIQQNFSSALANFKGETGPFQATDDRLHQLLEARFKEKPGGKGKPRAAMIAGAVALAIVLGWVGYSSYLLWEWSRFLAALRQQPGIAIISVNKSGGRFHVQGFRDPLAPDPGVLLSAAGFDPKKADLELLPFYSVDDVIVLRRAKELLHPPAGVKLSDKNGELRAEGVAPPKWIALFEERGRWIAGVSAIDDSHLQNSDLVELNRLKSALESGVLVFPLGRTELEPGQEAALAQDEKDLQGLLAAAQQLGGAITIEIIGHTDSTGIEAANLPLSRQRADQIFSVLRRAGVKPAYLRPRGVATSEPLRSEDTEEGRRYNRSVSFKVAFSPAPPVH